MFKITADFEGGNLRILEQRENEIFIETDLRDSADDWFYWCFKVEGAAGKTLTFKFESNCRVGYFGAAVSSDFKNWHWQYDEPKHEGGEFTYTFGENEDSLYFAHDILYRHERFYEFAEKNSFSVKTLCTSEKGRNVPYIEFGKGEEVILLTARHHACESTGSYVLEGVLEGFKNSLADKYRVICVPFVDLDGVIDGDQGKGRAPFDHNRDYGEDSLYNSTREIKRLSEKYNIKYAFDFHSPWHFLGENDTLFIPITRYEMIKRVTRFANILENEIVTDALPFFAGNLHYPDTGWNKSNTPNFSGFFGKSCELCFTLETPYFIADGIMFSPERAKNTGACLVRALKKYIERNFRVAVAGDLLYQTPTNELCKTADGYNYRGLISESFPSLLDCDFLTANPETPFAGEKYNYTHDKWKFNTPEEALFTLKKCGFDLLTFANNHCLDRGVAGLYDMCEILGGANMNYIGISAGERNSVYIKETDWGRIAFLNFTYGTNAFHNLEFLNDEEKFSAVSLLGPQETLAGAPDLLENNEKIGEAVKNIFSPDCKEVKPYLELVKKDMEYAKANADYVIVLLHSGGQYNAEVDPYTELVAERLKNMGADMIIANHPHIIMPCRLDNDLFTCYSLGNLQSADKAEELKSEINPEYSAVVYLDFIKGEREPRIEFSVMKIEVGNKQNEIPKTYDAFDLYNKTGDGEIKKSALYLANRFMPNMNYTKLSRRYKIR